MSPQGCLGLEGVVFLILEMLAHAPGCPAQACYLALLQQALHQGQRGNTMLLFKCQPRLKMLGLGVGGRLSFPGLFAETTPQRS